MLNVESIPSYYLGAVRQALGASDANDTGYDEQISYLSIRDFCRLWSQWEIGSPEWGETIYNIICKLDSLKGDNNV